VFFTRPALLCFSLAEHFSCAVVDHRFDEAFGIAFVWIKTWPGEQIGKHQFLLKIFQIIMGVMGCTNKTLWPYKTQKKRRRNLRRHNGVATFTFPLVVVAKPRFAQRKSKKMPAMIADITPVKIDKTAEFGW
jgi:hypothetical protein